MIRYKWLAYPVLVSLAGCTTLEESMRLGAATGALTGVAAAYAVGSSDGHTSSGRVTEIATAGLAIGMLLSYIVHQEAVKDRLPPPTTPEIYFGDLPPNPFVFPQPVKQKGAGR